MKGKGPVPSPEGNREKALGNTLGVDDGRIEAEEENGNTAARSEKNSGG